MEKIKGKIFFDYDSDADVLYSYINKPQPAKDIELDNGIVLNVDFKSGKLIGFIVIDYGKRLKKGMLKNIIILTATLNLYCH